MAYSSNKYQDPLIQNQYGPPPPPIYTNSQPQQPPPQYHQTYSSQPQVQTQSHPIQLQSYPRQLQPQQYVPTQQPQPQAAHPYLYSPDGVVATRIVATATNPYPVREVHRTFARFCCGSTQLNTTYPDSLIGYVTPHEYAETMKRLIDSLKPTPREEVIYYILLLVSLGFIFYFILGTSSVQWAYFGAYGFFWVLAVLYRVIYMRRNIRKRLLVAIAQENNIYAQPSRDEQWQTGQRTCYWSNAGFSVVISVPNVPAGALANISPVPSYVPASPQQQPPIQSTVAISQPQPYLQTSYPQPSQQQQHHQQQAGYYPALQQTQQYHHLA